jgi:hypothetical protein
MCDRKIGAFDCSVIAIIRCWLRGYHDSPFSVWGGQSGDTFEYRCRCGHVAVLQGVAPHV